MFGLDHVVIRINLEADSQKEDRKRRHIFRFKGVWSKDDRCEEPVIKSWKGYSNHKYNQVKAMRPIFFSGIRQRRWRHERKSSANVTVAVVQSWSGSRS
ncbi:hypothetical protein KIW84_014671 [Lathyrus oleraceus]|uniref:Uncharacterized protein n=1 Tax=Pisum sativum TaxID=3888 RepID=A0A9D5GZE1_PEA|nr:hypothetical protein KIW84_014671 [Pisum sativum]